MTKQEFDARLYKELEVREMALISFNIYLNPEYIEYWEKYKAGEYDWCYEFLMANRGLLCFKNTPVQFKRQAKQTLSRLRGGRKKSDFVKLTIK